MGPRTVGTALAAAALVAALAAPMATPAHATTLIRMGLEDLTTTNRLVVLGEVVDYQSYWNPTGTFILTDVRIEVLETLKGDPGSGQELSITLMGGTVNELTSLIVGGAALDRQTSYVLFLEEADLPGANEALTVRDHSQGVFELSVDESGELRAISQANGQHLVPDQTGSILPPGGFEGLPLDTLLREVREIAAQQPNGGR